MSFIGSTFNFQGKLPFLLVEESMDPVFSHSQINSFAGCYYVVAVDYSGNESEKSEIICRDNCYFFNLPNVFTPNGDGKNDIFTVISKEDETICPSFIRSISVKIINRYGQEIYSDLLQDPENIFRLWNGLNKQGMKVSAGIYYYQVDVSFESVSTLEEKYVGWLSVLY